MTLQVNVGPIMSAQNVVGCQSVDNLIKEMERNGGYQKLLTGVSGGSRMTKKDIRSFERRRRPYYLR